MKIRRSPESLTPGAPTEPLVTVVVPSLNHGQFLARALESIAAQDLACEVFVLDGGSCDGTAELLRQNSHLVTRWHSQPDGGQAAAINAGMEWGRAPYVCWLNADDELLPGGLARLHDALVACPDAVAAYGGCEFVDESGAPCGRHPTAPFSRFLLANYCLIAQPATLIRRSAWESVGGLDERLDMAMDYDLWWRLAGSEGFLAYVPNTVARTRMHANTKTHRRPRDHYREAMAVVRRHYGGVPLKWYLAWPYRVWLAERIARRQENAS